MSIKTLRKRIALVAVSALGVGLLSVAPASAGAMASGQITLTASGTTVNNSGFCTGSAADGTTAALSKPIVVGGTQTITLATGDSGRIELTGNAVWVTPTATGTVDATRKIITVSATGDSSFQVTGTGTITLKSYADSTSTTVLDDFFFTGVASCVEGVVASKSFIQVTESDTKILKNADYAAGTAIASGTTHHASTGRLDNSVDQATVFANNGTAYIHIDVNDAYGVPYTTSKTLSVNCTNNAVIEGQKGGNYYVTNGNSIYSIDVVQPTSGTALKTTCTVSVNGAVIGSKDLLFVGDLATIKAELFRNGDAEASAGASQYGVIRYYYYDAAGNTLTATGNLPALTSSTITKITNRIVTTDASSASDTTVRDAKGVAAGASEQSGRLAFNCLDYGTSKISVYAINASSTTITSNVVDAVCGGPAFNYTASLDKASYKTGEIATLTITAKNYNGGVAASNVTLGTGAAVALGGMEAVVAPSTADALTDKLAGTWTYTFKVGQDTGSFTGSVKINLGSAYASLSPLYNKAATVQYSIVSSSTSVSNAEVLAAIVKLIASINKQIRALQKSLKR